jgi:hypothetical protein
MGIVVGPQDVGRKVRIKLMGKPDELGVITNHEGCGECGHPCCKVRWEKRAPWERGECFTYTSRLEWADEDLL